MASTSTTSNNDDYESCTLCTSKYNRLRPSFCQCKHCSIPLCFDCMKEHRDEFLQDVAQISHRYNELQELVQTKQKLIVEETRKYIENVNQSFDTYINELRETQQKIIADTETAKQDAQNYVLQIDSDLHTLSIDIQALAKEKIVQMTKMKNLSMELKRIEQQVNTYQATRSENLIKAQPEFSLKFNCSSVPVAALQSPTIEAINVSETKVKRVSFEVTHSKTLNQPAVQQNLALQPKNIYRFNKDADSTMLDDNENNVGFNGMPTSYIIDRMASDGKNVLYTSYYNEEPDRIVYCLMNDADDNNADRYREWKQSRIKDMIWWGNIEKFVCATDDAIYTVDYVYGRFKILCAIQGNWSYTLLAANTNNIFFHYITNNYNINQIEVYKPYFQVVKVINVSTDRYLSTSSSFCVTDQFLASICIRKQNNRQVFQVNILDLDMNEWKFVRLGICNDSIEIRSDGKEQFFISTGRRKLHIVSSNGIKNTISLANNGERIAVLDDRRIAISKERTDMEIVTY